MNGAKKQTKICMEANYSNDITTKSEFNLLASVWDVTGNVEYIVLKRLLQRQNVKIFKISFGEEHEKN